MSVLATANAERWKKAKITRAKEFDAVARKLVKNRTRYQRVEARTGVPWFIIAVIHQRESSGDFSGVLHNGEAIIGKGLKTGLVPKGRGPFNSWEEAAVDALVNCPPFAARNRDWSVGGTLELLERYNGLGYFNRGQPSPYIWSGTNQYVRGKFVRDGVYDATAVDKQLGCAGLIMAMKKIDQTIGFGGKTAAENVQQQTTAYSADVFKVQEQLAQLGYHEVGAADGKVGSKTRGAIAAFLTDRGQNWSPEVGPALRVELMEAIGENWKRPIAPARAYATADDIAPKVKAVEQNRWSKFWTKMMAIPSSIGTTILGVTSAVPEADEKVAPYTNIVKGYLGDVPGWLWLLVIACVSFIIWRSLNRTEKAVVEDYQVGRIN